MKDLGILNDLTERQLADVNVAVAHWKESGTPGIFGFVSETQLNEIEDKAIEIYRKGLLTKIGLIAIPAGLISGIAFVGYNKLKKRKNKDQK